MNNCTGCKCCEYFCPTQAISIRKLGKTFICVIDKNKCINCNKCQNLCHLKNASFNEPINAYIAENKDLSARKRAASGGVASAIYKYCLDNGIICTGVVFEGGRAIYKILNHEDIRKVSGSKYVNSHLEVLYEQVSYIRDYMLSNQRFVFIGLPCHCMAMKKTLGKIEKMGIWIDLVCNGVCPEEDLWSDLRTHYNHFHDIDDIRFREKNNQYGITLRDRKWDVIKKIRNKNDKYMIMYADRENVFEHCKRCIYSQSKRVGDITLKDYVWKYGVSNVLINSKAGESFWLEIQELIWKKEYAVEKVLEDDERLH